MWTWKKQQRFVPSKFLNAFVCIFNNQLSISRAIVEALLAASGMASFTFMPSSRLDSVAATKHFRASTVESRVMLNGLLTIHGIKLMIRKSSKLLVRFLLTKLTRQR